MQRSPHGHSAGESKTHGMEEGSRMLKVWKPNVTKSFQ